MESQGQGDKIRSSLAEWFTDSRKGRVGNDGVVSPLGGRLTRQTGKLLGLGTGPWHLV